MIPASGPLKVYHLTDYLSGVAEQVNASVAAPSWARAADELVVPIGRLRRYGAAISVSEPCTELERLCLAEPGTVFYRFVNASDGEIHRWDPAEQRRVAAIARRARGGDPAEVTGRTP